MPGFTDTMKLTWIAFIIALLSAGKHGTQGDPPYGMMVEFIRESGQVRILDSKPEFTWIVPEKADRQTAFQILVSSSMEKADRDEADVWNSNKTMSSISSEVEYAGIELSENSSYFWKVRIWNNKEKPSHWSEIKSFKTGTLGEYQSTGNKFMETLTLPDKIVRTGEDRFFADFGKDAFGILILELEPLSNDTLIIHLGEKASGMNKIDNNPGGTIRYHRVLLPVEPGVTKYEVFIPPDERNTGPAAIHLPDSFGVITPFRYCELENCKLDLQSENLMRKAYWYFFDDAASSFTCSDTVLNRIWEISKYSIKATSFAGIYVDGDRERIPYEADAYINQLGHYSTDREYSIARRTSEYFITHPTWPTEWILQTVPLFFNDFMYTGNYESVRRYYHELQYRTLQSLARQDGLISSKNVTDEIMNTLGFSNAKERIRDIIDWPPSQKDTGWKLATAEGERDGYDLKDVNTVVNAFHFNNLILMSRLAGYLEKPADSVFFSNQAGRVKTAFNNTFLDKNKGYYVDGEFSGHSSLHANMMALSFGLVPEDYKESVIEFIKSRGMACSVYGAQYLLEALYSAGEGDYALGLLTATGERSWWNMIRSGSTITIEAWDLKFKPNSDWNHAWGAAPANIIPGYMWGIRPLTPGYSKAVVKPQLSRLTYSNISVPTIRGNIKAEFKVTGKSEEYLITIPANMDCDLILGDVKNLTIKVNGKKQNTSTGIIKLRTGNNKILIP